MFNSRLVRKTAPRSAEDSQPHTPATVRDPRRLQTSLKHCDSTTSILTKNIFMFNRILICIYVEGHIYSTCDTRVAAHDSSLTTYCKLLTNILTEQELLQFLFFSVRKDLQHSHLSSWKSSVAPTMPWAMIFSNGVSIYPTWGRLRGG
jgi:hypothetical protein